MLKFLALDFGKEMKVLVFEYRMCFYFRTPFCNQFIGLMQISIVIVGNTRIKKIFLEVFPSAMKFSLCMLFLPNFLQYLGIKVLYFQSSSSRG